MLWQIAPTVPIPLKIFLLPYHQKSVRKDTNSFLITNKSFATNTRIFTTDLWKFFPFRKRKTCIRGKKTIFIFIHVLWKINYFIYFCRL